METKIQKEFIDKGFGFPIRLVNVPMIKVRGAWTPKINYNELALAVLRALAYKESRITGSEIKFIRTHFEMNLKEFANRFCVTHAGVIKWEKSLDKPTMMSWSAEKDIRLFVLRSLAAKAQELANLYDDLEELRDAKAEPIHLDVKKIAA